MHCDYKDIARWKRTKRLKKQSEKSDFDKKINNPILLKSKTEETKKILNVIKKDGTTYKVNKD